MVGVSCLVSTKFEDALRVCRLVKQTLPRCTTVMGGAHVTAAPLETLAHLEIDYLVFGEGEQTLLELVEHLAGRGPALEIIDGLGYRTAQGTPVIQPRTRFIQNLDSLPLPARHLIPLERYWEVNLPHGEATRTPWTTLVTSRGCVANCTYCSAHMIWGSRYRARSAENVLAEIRMLVETYGIKELLIEDDNFTLDKRRTAAILDGIIAAGWDLSWTTPSGVAIYSLDEHLLAKIKASGCKSLTFAVESGSQRVLKHVIHKPLSLQKVREVIAAAKKLGIKTKAFFMLGIPGETRAEMEETLAMARELAVDWSCFSIASPLPGTPMAKECLEAGYLPADLDFRGIEFGKAVITTPEFGPRDVEAMWDRCNAINFLENPNLREGGNLEQAVFDFQRVIRLVPTHLLAHRALARAFTQKGMAAEAAAEESLAKAIEQERKHL